MIDTNDSRYKTGHTVGDALRFLCDASFAILPRDVAHQLGEFEKNLWGGVRWLAEKKIEWIDEAVHGGDRLREEWRRNHHTAPHTTTTPGGAESL
ncbi:MAG: hypothetical protein LC754_00535 [Acidobacteria bacterium]|nr:hypothetical protein [Acidobacteriota bacterium]